MFVVDLNNAYNNSMYGKTSKSSCTYSRLIVILRGTGNRARKS